MLKWLKQLFVQNNPIPGQDAHWTAYCDHCQEYESFASRYGLKNGGIEHCYTCGVERKTNGFKEKDIQYLISASKAHWRKYPIIPYNWHELEESKRWKILFPN